MQERNTEWVAVTQGQDPYSASFCFLCGLQTTNFQNLKISYTDDPSENTFISKALSNFVQFV